MTDVLLLSVAVGDSIYVTGRIGDRVAVSIEAGYAVSTRVSLSDRLGADGWGQCCCWNGCHRPCRSMSHL